MKVDNVSFNDDFVKGFKSEKEFIEEMNGEGYRHIFEGTGRTDKLKNVYALHNKKSEKPKVSQIEQAEAEATKP